VQDGVVDRRAQHLAERHRAERRVVVDVAGLGTALADQVVRQCVELEQVHPDVGGGRQPGQHVGDEAAGRFHLLDLHSGSQLDHDASLRAGVARPRVGP